MLTEMRVGVMVGTVIGLMAERGPAVDDGLVMVVIVELVVVIVELVVVSVVVSTVVVPICISVSNAFTETDCCFSSGCSHRFCNEDRCFCFN